MNEKYTMQVIEDIGKLTRDGICIYDIGRDKFLYVNGHFLNLFGVSHLHLESGAFSFVERLAGDDREFAARHYKELLALSKVEDLELRIQCANNVKILSVTAFLLERKHVIVAILKDVTSAKEHFNYIVEFGARKDALLDMVAHNLSGPLNLTTQLLDAVDQLHNNQEFEKADEFHRLIRASNLQCIEIINSFLEEEHSESERVIVKRNLFNPSEKVQIVVDRIKQFNRDKEIEVVTNQENIFVRADDVKFFQIVHNLISNAVKFTRSDGKIRVEIKFYDDAFEFIVEDNGIGIPEHFQPRIFERNSPASRPGLKGESSIGMGLYIVRKLTEMMRGIIEFKSEEGAGTIFTLRFPRE